MASDRRYLEWHGNQWRVRIKVPVKLRPIINKSKLVHPLHTDSLNEANRRKHQHVARFLALLAAARSGTRPDDLTEEALAVRARVAAERDGRPKFDFDDPMIPQGRLTTDEADAALTRAYELEAAHGPEAAS